MRQSNCVQQTPVQWKYKYETILKEAARHISSQLGLAVCLAQATPEYLAQWVDMHQQDAPRHDVGFHWQGLAKDTENRDKDRRNLLLAMSVQDKLCAFSHYRIQTDAPTLAVMQTQAVNRDHALKGNVRYISLQTALMVARYHHCSTLMDMGPFYNPKGAAQCRQLGFNEIAIRVPASMQVSGVEYVHFTMDIGSLTPEFCFRPQQFKVQG